MMCDGVVTVTSVMHGLWRLRGEGHIPVAVSYVQMHWSVDPDEQLQGLN